MRCHVSERVTFGQQQVTEFGLAQPRRVCQYGLEDGPQVTR